MCLAIDQLLVRVTGGTRSCLSHNEVRVSRDRLEACKTPKTQTQSWQTVMSAAFYWPEVASPA